jgi:hypothetical protein
MTTLDVEQRTARTRALSRISGARDGRRYGQRFDAAREADLLAYAATLSDETILDWRDTGPGVLGWIRTHQPAPGIEPEYSAADPTNLGVVLQSTGWRIEVFWNSAGGWFTARLVSLWDRDGNATYSGGSLVPFGDPIGMSGESPQKAFAHLSEAVLEWS